MFLRKQDYFPRRRSRRQGGKGRGAGGSVRPFSTAGDAVAPLAPEEAPPHMFANHVGNLCQRCLLQLRAELNRSCPKCAVGISPSGCDLGCPAVRKPVAQGGLQMHDGEHSASSRRRPEC